MSKLRETITVSSTDVRQNLSKLLNQAYRDQTRVVVERSGVPIAVIVSPRELPTLERADKDWEEFDALLSEIQTAFANLDPEELQSEIDKALAEVRTAKRAQRTEAGAA